MSASRTDAQAGQEVAPIGDLDGDGYADFVVGDNKITDTGESSYAAVFLGDGRRMASEDTSDAPLLLEGSPADGAFGEIAALGDVDGDGHVDAAFTAAEREGSAGAVFILAGAAVFPSTGRIDTLSEAVWAGSREGLRLGASVSGPGDLSGDGYADVVTSTERDGFEAGEVFVLEGEAGLSGAFSEEDAWAVVIGGATEAEGEAVAGPIDVNADGAPDLLFGAFDLATTQGEAWLLYGRP